MKPKQVFVVAPKDFIKILKIFYVSNVIQPVKPVEDLAYRIAFHVMIICILEF